MILVQNGAPGHSARDTLQELTEGEIICSRWPPFSPNLNSIETVWNWMKDWQNHYDDEQLGDQGLLRTAVKGAWDAVPTAYLQELLDSMPAHCQAVIDADGRHTRC